MPDQGFFVWPLTQRLARLLADCGLLVCPLCGCVTHNRYALEAHWLFRCRGRVRVRAAAIDNVDLVGDAPTS